MKKLLTLVVGAVLLASSVNAASLNNETVRSVMSEMGRINTSMKGLLKENDGLGPVNNSLIKKNKLWEEQLTSRIAPKETLFVAKAKAHIAREAVYKQRIERHNDACPKRMPPGPQYNKCKSEEPTLNRIRDRHHAEKADLNRERSGLIAERESYEKLIRDNNTKITRNYNRHLAIKAAVGRYEQRLEYYRTRLITLCSTADRNDWGESIHYCQSMRWDGTRKNLPTLEEILKGTRFFGK